MKHLQLQYTFWNATFPRCTQKIIQLFSNFETKQTMTQSTTVSHRLAAVVAIIFLYLGLAEITPWAQQKMANVKTEDDVIANSVIQRIDGTSKVRILGPMIQISSRRSLKQGYTIFPHFS